MKPDLYNWISSVAADHGVEAAAEIAKFEARHVYAVKVHFTQDVSGLKLTFHRSSLKRRRLTATILSQRQSMCSWMRITSTSSWPVAIGSLREAAPPLKRHNVWAPRMRRQ